MTGSSEFSADKFADLRAPRRLWLVGPSTGRADALAELHDNLFDRIGPGDRLVYLGGYAGGNGRQLALDEMLMFRRALLSRDGFMASDIVYLRGREEEAFQRVFRLPFAASPPQELARLIDAGAARYLNYYAFSLPDIHGLVRAGLAPLTRWLNQLRGQVRDIDGHETFWLQLKRAAFTSANGAPGGILATPFGLAPDKSLAEQQDSWWQEGRILSLLQTPALGFHRIIRGRDPAGLGLDLGPVVLTLDDADGTTPVLAACLAADGTVEEIISAACPPKPSDITDMPEAATELPVATQFAARLSGAGVSTYVLQDAQAA